MSKHEPTSVREKRGAIEQYFERQAKRAGLAPSLKQEAVAASVMLARTLGDVVDVRERIREAFARGERPASLMAFARSEDRRELGQDCTSDVPRRGVA